MSCCFSELEQNDLLSRELPLPTVRPSLRDLDGAIIFGSGVLAQQVLSRMREVGIAPAWIVDNNSNLWGSSIDGVIVRPADSLEKAGEKLVLIASSFLKPMIEDCERAGVSHWAWFFNIREVFGSLSFVTPAHEILEEAEIDRLHSLLADFPVSQNVLKRALTFRVTGNARDLPDKVDHQYFVEGLIPSKFYFHFVDCGAFMGDTLLDWVYRMRGIASRELRYYGFEPDPANYPILEHAVHGLPDDLQERCFIYPFAVGATTGEIGMAQGNSGTVLSDDFAGGPRVRVVRLDDILRDESVGVIKMDLEGFELMALEGCVGILEAQRPALLVAIYHRTDHLWKIPLWIHDLGLGYKLHLRHHASSFAETICYAVPE